MKLIPASKQKIVAGLAYNPCRCSDVIPDGDDYPLCKHWNALPKLRKTMLTENPPIAHMEVIANKHTVVICRPSLITRSYRPHDDYASHPDAIVGKKNEMEMSGGLNAHDFST